MNRILAIVALSTFAAALAVRAVDPMLPQIAREFTVDIHTAALLNASFAFAYAIVQPFLGAAADLFGKTRLIIICLAVLAVTLAAGAMATSFPFLLATRVISGGAAGGVFPIAMGVAGDLVPVHQRQVAMGRFLGSAMAGNLLGATAAGLIADFAGWRAVFAVLLVAVAVSCAATAVTLRAATASQHPTLNLRELMAGYRGIFSNPNAKVCFAAVAVEGFTVFGLFPYVATLLAERGETRLSIAGLVIGGFAIGGVAYSLAVSRMLPRLGQGPMMIIGALVMASQFALIALGLPWGAQLVFFVTLGFAFYMLHGSLQVFATELAPSARASAASLHAFSFFVGQAFGPLYYGYALTQFGERPALIFAGLLIAATGLVATWLLVRRPRDVA